MLRKAPKFGDVFKNSRLAASYQAIAEGGQDAFYQGPIAEEIVKFSQANGGYFELKDFQDHTSTWVDPVSTNYRGYDVWELPPNGQGIAALEMLNILEGYDLKKMGRLSADYLHLLVEAKKLAFADRAKFYADPEFDKLPIAELISKEYAARQRERIDLNQAARDVPAGDPKFAHGDTIYLTVVDKDRNCCSFIQSNFHGFGSKVVPGNVGFVRAIADARARLLTTAGRIGDPAYRRSFLEDVPENARTLALAHAWLGEPAPGT
jgi:gamma-glutamyltranspeptidase/glutathione hydrolase